MPIRSRHSLVTALVVILLMELASGAILPVRRIDLSTPRETLPCRIDIIRPHCNEGTDYSVADLNGDDQPEYMYWYSNPAPGGLWQSAVVACSDPWTSDAILQYNGQDEWARQVNVSFFDCIGSRGDDIIVARVHGDTILFTIVAFDSAFAQAEMQHVVAAVGQNMNPPGYFHSLHINSLAAVDLTGDGCKDFIFGRSVKPETAFERALIAYDLRNRREIWRFPVSDLIGRRCFKLVRLVSGEHVFVFAVNSANNLYRSTNGMTSDTPYLCSIGMDGRERWRHAQGNAFWNPSLSLLDMNGDGIEEAVTLLREGEVRDSMVLSLRCYDVATGRLIARSESLRGTWGSMCPLVDSTDGDRFIALGFASGQDLCIAKFDTGLHLVDIVSGLELTAVQDYDRDGHPEILANNQQQLYAALDKNLKLLALTARNEIKGGQYPFKHSQFTLRCNENDYELVSLTRRSLTAYWFGKYKWYLAVALALVLLVAGLQVLRWAKRIRLAAAGIPGLDKVDALVMVLDRKGKVTFVSEHSLARHLIGADSPRGKHYGRLFTKQTQSLLHLIERSYSQPLITLQEQLEVEIDGTAANLLVATYPRLDQSNRFLGKVVVVENITNRLDWQRKVVLGEAAQRWVHNLKNSLATARLYLDNLEEDPRLDDRVRREVLSEYLPTVRSQIMNTSDTASKILRFSSIRKPEPIAYDINALVDSAVGPYAASPKPNLTVAKKQQPDLPSVEIDPGQIKEVLDNLLSNAVFAMKKGGKLTIATRLAEDLPQGNGRKMIEIVVEDTGIGIAQSDMDKIFQPGFSKSGSTGVGLALVKEIVENHAGEVTVESRLGQGTRFAVRLPVGRA